MSVQPLLTPLRMGDLDLPNRIVTAPLTHMREVERLATGAPLAEVDWKTVYASGRRGYTDYPAIRLSAGQRPSEVKL